MKLNNPSEHEEQKIVCKYLDLLKVPYFSIPNGFKYHGILKMIEKAINKFLYQKIKIKVFREVKLMKDEGMKSGVPDMFIPVAYHGKNGLFIEMKSLSGKMSPEQKDWFVTLEKQGYKCVCCKGAAEAIKEIDNYMGK